jgi:hypothetical protein
MFASAELAITCEIALAPHWGAADKQNLIKIFWGNERALKLAEEIFRKKTGHWPVFF